MRNRVRMPGFKSEAAYMLGNYDWILEYYSTSQRMWIGSSRQWGEDRFASALPLLAKAKREESGTAFRLRNVHTGQIIL